MDETFWKGTISEGKIQIPEENITIIKELTDRGIINSICSKNNFEPVKQELEKIGIWDYFVFPKISWNPKGPQIKDIVDQIKLRPETILFIDDNKTNLEEVKFYVPSINVAGPEIIPLILNSERFTGKDDKKHSRLKQYKVLEEKAKDESKYSDNHDFLLHSNINVVIDYECAKNIDRIWELNQRTNQLNFTKNRVSREEIERILNSPEYKCATISVTDNYGQYGIVGFAALSNNRLEHFYFSCRTIGLGIEQYVYFQFGSPEISVVGDVATKLEKDNCPDWINIAANNNDQQGDKYIKTDKRILITGGCDLEQTAYYLEQTGINFETQFNYLANERFECHPEALENLRNSIELSSTEKSRLIKECPFYDNKVFDNKLLSESYDVVVFSPLIDMAIGTYRRRKDNHYVVYGNFDFPSLHGNGYMSLAEQEEFLKQYEFIGKTSAKRFRENLRFIINKIDPNTQIIIINGSEQNINNPLEPHRYQFHKELNQEIKTIVKEFDNCSLIDVNTIIESESAHTDTIRHYERQVYYNMALDIVDKFKELGIISQDINFENLKKSKRDYRLIIKKYLRKMGLLKFFYRT